MMLPMSAEILVTFAGLALPPLPEIAALRKPSGAVRQVRASGFQSVG